MVSSLVSIFRNTDAPRERIHPIAIRGFACFPTLHPEEQRKKGGSIWRRSKDERRGSSLVGAYQHSGCYPRIYMPMKLLPPSVTVLTYLSTAVCFVRTDRLGESTTSLHPPNGTHDRAFARLCEFSRLSYESGPFFFVPTSVRPEKRSSLLHFSFLMHLCAYPNVAPIIRTNDPTKVLNFRAQCSGIERGTNAVY